MIQQVPVKTGYNIWSTHYDVEPNVLMAVDEANSDKKIKSIGPFSSNKTILDVCCGTGRHIPLFERLFHKTTAIDFSENMTQLAIKRVRKPNTEIFTNDFLTWSTDQRFDFIHCSLALMHFRDLRQLLRKASSLLNKCGHIYITDGSDSWFRCGSPNFDLNGANYVLDYYRHESLTLPYLGKLFGLKTIEFEQLICDYRVVSQHVKFQRYLGKPCLFYWSARKALFS